MLHCVAVCLCSVMHCVAVFRNTVADCCSVSQATSCKVLLTQAAASNWEFRRCQGYGIEPRLLIFCVNSWFEMLFQGVCAVAAHAHCCSKMHGVDTKSCDTLEHTATHRSTLQHTLTHCNTLQLTARHCNTMPGSVVRSCNTQHTHAGASHVACTATHSHNAMQYTATQICRRTSRPTPLSYRRRVLLPTPQLPLLV